MKRLFDTNLYSIPITHASFTLKFRDKMRPCWRVLIRLNDNNSVLDYFFSDKLSEWVSKESLASLPKQCGSFWMQNFFFVPPYTHEGNNDVILCTVFTSTGGILCCGSVTSWTGMCLKTVADGIIHRLKYTDCEYLWHKNYKTSAFQLISLFTFEEEEAYT